ncbi:alpha-amylase [Longimicrobium terrae]|uniref:Starch synthase (Maltosyl-transferring) n=1 Tax=Longimicrobium terrae TaxID=1639882 RepID=A0A841GJR8_9BACT|nr:starch synthase (maltosyl-transferring) [Longimicrobium terrae]MBB6068817.1 starch synthase (maltosyl-transferring) [Longimicrobium terrae]NNC28001.1 alpha-amylase [Longimicrobium terrae]
MNPPLIYNLFPRLVGPTTRWAEHARRAREMEFDWLYLNPWHYPGFSGSLYAVKDFRRLNPAFLPAGADSLSLEPLRAALAQMNEMRIRPVMDLVVNHTSKDSPLIDQHPGWYARDEHGQVRSPFVVDPDDPSKVTTWGDLAEIENLTHHDREGLWRYWAQLVREAVELGFRGFRCDAAYKVPAGLWRYLIGEAKKVDEDVVFFAETLGAPVEDVVALKSAGFDFFFNSSKWWNFSEPWALAQHEAFGAIAPSIAFPESHDTPRLAAETDGDVAVQKQRYAFAAAYSAGVMMPVGYEFGFRKQVDVVRTVPTDWERRHVDLRPFITRVNRLKRTHPLLNGEGHLRPLGGMDGDTLILRRSDDANESAGVILVNKVWKETREVPLGEIVRAPHNYRLHRVCRDGYQEGGEPVPATLTLERAEVAYVLPLLPEAV